MYLLKINLLTKTINNLGWGFITNPLEEGRKAKIPIINMCFYAKKGFFIEFEIAIFGIMREHITDIETYGVLKIPKLKLELKDVRAEYKRDYYSNKYRYGVFYIKYLSPDELNKLRTSNNYEFKTFDYNVLKGEIFSINLCKYKDIYHYSLRFDLEEIFSWIRFKEGLPKKIEIEFRIPYVEILKRDLDYPFGEKKGYIVKFDTKPIKIKVAGSDFVFKENTSFIKHKDPDTIFSRDIIPAVEISLEGKFNLLGVIKKHLVYMHDIMLMVSFLVSHKLYCFGYSCFIYSDVEKKNHIQTVTYKTYERVFEDEFTTDDIDYVFKDYFVKKNFQNLVNSFVKVSNPKLVRLIHSFLTANEIKIIEPRFLSIFFVLEGISKMIYLKRSLRIIDFDEKNQSKFEEMLKVVCSECKIDLGRINFLPKKKNNKNDWLITEYRNDLVHVNKINIDFREMIEETKKIFYLSRKLILNYIHRPLTDFPFHKSTRNLFT